MTAYLALGGALQEACEIGDGWAGVDRDRATVLALPQTFVLVVGEGIAVADDGRITQPLERLAWGGGGATGILVAAPLPLVVSPASVGSTGDGEGGERGCGRPTSESIEAIVGHALLQIDWATGHVCGDAIADPP